MAFTLDSPAFDDGGEIPGRFARGGDNVSPPLEWSDPPPGTQSYALLMEDPDVEGRSFKHWGLFHIDAGRDHLPEALDAGAAEDLRFCENDFGERRYDGPQPPKGAGPHRYVFKLAALSVEALAEESRLSVEEMWRLAEPHIIGVAECAGRYAR
jgi:Raf kinase inhibitor-like YbhB/YbcL family protein